MIPAFLAIFHGYFHFEDEFLPQLTLGTAMACSVVNSSCTALALKACGVTRKSQSCCTLPPTHCWSWSAFCAVASERQRMMQDMHVGLGSQLPTSLVAVERGALDPKGMALTPDHHSRRGHV